MLTTKEVPIDYMVYQDQLLIGQKKNKASVFDPIRKKQIIITPEEMVRQLMICYLIHNQQYNKNRISVEKKLLVNGLDKRFDLLVYDAQVSPYLLIECKAPEVPIRQGVFDQIARYNLALKVPYLVVTNGLKTYCCKINYTEENYDFLPDFPPPPQD